jgi:hypothetical protein
MCSVCSNYCSGSCEIGLSAIRGSEITYPLNTSSQQFASEKRYPFDYSHFNINGRVFGAKGAAENSEQTNVNSVDINCEVGYKKKIKLKAPIILPAIAKLNWQDYYSGAAMAGIIAVIGESAIKGDPDLNYDGNGKVSNAPLLGNMINCFREYDLGYGDIVLQVNADDIAVGTPEYALTHFDLKTIEIKFGQAAKGIQHVAPVYSYEEALHIKQNGYLVFPDPQSNEVKKEYQANPGFYFMQYGRLPMWDEDFIAAKIERYRNLGAENIFFKMAGYDISDIRRVLKIASDNKIALVTFDGAGGGTGHSPIKMMNEWGLPTITLEQTVVNAMTELNVKGLWLPSIAIAGGITMEDTIFKALALGSPYINLVAIGRAAMAAAISAKNVGEMIKNGNIPLAYKNYGDSLETIFRDYKLIKHRYREAKSQITTGSVGVYSYIERVSFGLKLFMTLNRKFKLSYINQDDIIPLTYEAKEYLSNITMSKDS